MRVNLHVPQIDNFIHNSFLLRCVFSQEFALLPFGSKEMDDKGFQFKTVDVLYERTKKRFSKILKIFKFFEEEDDSKCISSN